MSDILITSPFQPFTLPTQFKAVFNGYIYCGTVDAVDPSVSQIQVYLVNESGDKVPVAQPLRTNAGGFLVYNGQPAKFVTSSNHSLLVQDAQHAQLWYAPDVSMTDPASLSDVLAGEDGSSMIGFIQSGSGAVPQAAQDKMREGISPADFSGNNTAMIQELIARGKNAAVFNSYHAFTLTVGTGGHYPDLMSAIVAAQAMRPMWDNGQAYCEIRLKTGYVLNAQMEFGAGADLSWIKITSEDSIVYASTSAFTKHVVTYYDYKYLFYFHDSAKSPLFSILIEENRSGSDVVAFVATSGSTLNFNPGSGARRFFGGVNATYGATVMGYHTGTGSAPVGGYFLCDFSNSVGFSLSAIINCRVHLPYSKFENSQGEYAVFCIWSTIADFRFSSANGCTNGAGWYIRDGSVVSIRDCSATGCDRGISAYHGVVINARGHDTDDSSGVPIDPVKHLGLYGCNYGIYADGSCEIEASGLDMRNCTTAIQAFRNSNITAQANCFDGSSTVLQLSTGCKVVFSRASAIGVKKLCLLEHGSHAVTWLCNANSTGVTTLDTRFIDIRVGSKFSMANNTVIATTAGIFAENGSEFCALDSVIGALRISSYTGSRASIENTPWNFTYVVGGTPILNVQRGGMINAVGQRGQGGEALTANITPLTLNASGIIFYQ